MITAYKPDSKRIPIEGATTLGLRAYNVNELIKKLETGFKADVADRIAQTVGLPFSTFAKELQLTSSTVSKAKKHELPLSRDTSETLYRVARIFERTLTLFDGDKAKAARWVTTPKHGLNDQSPLRFARTEPGGETVLTLLDEITDGGPA